MPRRVLFVCTANICRSPTAELLARSRFGETNAMFRSAGFMEGGREISPDMGTLLAEIGIDSSGHRSYKIDEASINAADIILVMESAHLQRLTRIDNTALSKAMPLTEAASLLESIPAPIVPIPEFLARLNADRDPRTYLDARWDVEDPYGGKAKEYRVAFSEIDQLVRAVVPRLISPIEHS